MGTHHHGPRPSVQPHKNFEVLSFDFGSHNRYNEVMSKRDDMFSKGRAHGKAHGATGDMASLIDQKREFEKFQAEVLPALRKDLASGMTDEQLREKYMAYVQAAQLTTALTDPRAGAERKDIIDRQRGKATERKEVTHKLSALSDEELQALVMTEMEEIEDGSKDPTKD